MYSLEALFFQTIPYMIYFLISLLVICYISCKKYRLFKVVVPISIIQQDQSYYVNLLKTIKKYLKLNIWSILLIFLLMPENVARIIILALNVKCEDTGTFTGFLVSFQTVFTILYPIFINYRLNNYHWNKRKYVSILQFFLISLVAILSLILHFQSILTLK